MIDTLSVVCLFLVLLILMLVSAFFAGSETGMMSLNRYRLRHLAKNGLKSAKCAKKLLENPDRLLGIILIGNTFANIFASSIATIIAVYFFGKIGIFIATISLTIFVLIFSEVLPKTLGALYPQRFSLLAAFPLQLLLWFLYPIVWFCNFCVNNILRLFGIKITKKYSRDSLSAEELHTLVYETGDELSTQDRDMLLHILELNYLTVEDIMCPRYEIDGIDLDDDWDNILQALLNTDKSYLPVFRGNISNVCGTINLIHVLKLLADDELSNENFTKYLSPACFIPNSANLANQLLTLKQNKHHLAFIVDEYGELQGMITLENILEEVVGEFAVDVGRLIRSLHEQKDGGYIIDASITLRELNKLTGWHFPVDGPKTLNGLIVEHLKDMPIPNVSIRIGNYGVEILSVKHNMVKMSKVFPI